MTQPNAQSSLLLFENYHHSLFSTSFPNGNASFSHSLLNTNQSDGFFHSQHSPTTTLSLPAHHHYHPSSSSDLPRPHHHHHQQQIDSFPSSFPTPVSCNFSFPRIRRSNPFLLLSGDSSFPTINPSLSEMVHNHSTLNAETSSSTASAISGFKSKTQRQTSFYEQTLDKMKKSASQLYANHSAIHMDSSNDCDTMTLHSENEMKNISASPCKTKDIRSYFKKQ